MTTTTQMSDKFPDLLQASLFSHRLRAEVGVCSGAVPVSGHWLRVECDDDAEVLGDAVQQEPRHPQMVTHGDALARPNLELSLCNGKHDLTHA